MDSIRVRKINKWFGPDTWQIEWETGARTFIHGYYITKTKEFKTFQEMIDYCRTNSWHLGWRNGGGFGVGVYLIWDDFVIAEFWKSRKINGKQYKIDKVYLNHWDKSIAHTGNYEKYGELISEDPN